MGNVTISTEEYSRLIGNSSKKSKGHHRKQSPAGQSPRQSSNSREGTLIKEINALETEKRNILRRSEQEAAKKKGFKKFFAKVGDVAAVASLNRQINEKRRVLGMYGQKEDLAMQRDIVKMKTQISKDKAELQEQRKKSLLKEEDIFGTGDLFRI